MKLWDLLKTANRNLFRNKLRTALTVAAIFIGSFTLTMTNGVGDGMRSYINAQVKNVESDTVLFVRRKRQDDDKPPSRDKPREYRDESTKATTPNQTNPNSRFVTLPQMEDAVNAIADVKSVTPQYQIDGEYITLDGEKKYDLGLEVISPGVTQKVEAGKTISKINQIVIPLSLARTLDPQIENLIGKMATIGYKAFDHSMRTHPLEIVGVATKGFAPLSNAFVDSQTASIISADQSDPNLAGKFISFAIQLSSSDQAKIDSVKAKLADKGFTGESMADRQKRTDDAIGIFKIIMGLVAFIALLAASFGIINTLVIAVMERTKEIGLQKALGMDRLRIFAIFSLESVLIGFWGAAIGIVGAIFVGLIANQILSRAYAESFEGYSLFVFTIPSILIVMVLVCTISFVAGVLPAIRASRLNPIESLRYE